MNCAFGVIILTALFLCLRVNNALIPPTITRQPPAGEIFIHSLDPTKGKSLFLECEAAAEPLPTYYWKKNGNHFNWQQHADHISQRPKKGTLEFIDFSHFDTGTYQCFAENDLGTASSNEVTVTLPYLSTIESPTVVSVNGTEGQPFNLTCGPPQGKPKPRVLWFSEHMGHRLVPINDSRITFDPEGTLWFSYLTKDDAARDLLYVCTATSEAARTSIVKNKFSINITETNLKEFEPFLQYASKNNSVAKLGKNIELFCIFGGRPVPSITWTKNDTPIEYSNYTKPRNFGRSLLIKAVDFDDKGAYVCEASNGIGINKTHSIQLEILASPYFIEQPQSLHRNSGETAELRCVAGGNPKPCIKWFYNGKLLDTSKTSLNLRRTVESQTLMITNLTITDTGNYGCKASNILGHVYKDVYINVIETSPELTKIAANQGDSIILKCITSDSHDLKIKWYHNDIRINKERFSVLRNGSLSIQDVKAEDAGLYKCHAIVKETIKLIVENTVNADDTLNSNSTVASGSANE